MILFVTGTGTGVGKTIATTALTQHAVSIGLSVAALKPFETGCAPDALDALALAEACKRPGFAAHPSFYRVEPPLSPYAATLAGCAAPDVEAIVAACQHIAREVDFTVVEGAGGLLVPVDETHSMADVASRLGSDSSGAMSQGSKLLLVAPDRLGVLSDVLATFECAQRRGLEVGAIVLNRGLTGSNDDPSRLHNADILHQRCGVPIVPMDAFNAADPTAWVRQSALLNLLGVAH